MIAETKSEQNQSTSVTFISLCAVTPSSFKAKVSQSSRRTFQDEEFAEEESRRFLVSHGSGWVSGVVPKKPRQRAIPSGAVGDLHRRDYLAAALVLSTAGADMFVEVINFRPRGFSGGRCRRRRGDQAPACLACCSTLPEIIKLAAAIALLQGEITTNGPKR